MYRLTFPELADIHLAYGAANGNAVEARRLYAERYPGRHLPDRRFFISVDRRLRETGSFEVSVNMVALIKLFVYVCVLKASNFS